MTTSMNSTLAASAVKRLFETTATDIPTGLDFGGEAIDIRRTLVEHFDAGSCWPSSVEHERIVYDVSETHGITTIVDAAIEYCATQDSRNAGNLGRHWLALAHTCGVDIFARLDAADADPDTRIGVLEAANVHSFTIIDYVIERDYGPQRLWSSLLRSNGWRHQLSQELWEAIGAYIGIEALLEFKHHGDFVVSHATLLGLLRGCETSAVIGVKAGFNNFNCYCWEAVAAHPCATVGDTVLLAARFDTSAYDAVNDAVTKLVSDRIKRNDFVALSQLNDTFLETLLEGQLAVVFKDFVEHGDVNDVAGVLNNSRRLKYYLEHLPVRGAVLEAAVASGAIDAGFVTTHAALLQKRDQQHLMVTVSGVLAAFGDMLVERRTPTAWEKSAQRAVFETINKLFITTGANVNDGHGRLWSAVIDRQPNSPAANTMLSSEEVAEVYISRWGQAQQRKKAATV